MNSIALVGGVTAALLGLATSPFFLMAMLANSNRR